MKKIIGLLILLLYSTGHAQSISKSVIGSAGKNTSNSTVKLSWTTGEPIIGVMTAGGNQLGNGYYPSMNLQVLNIEEFNLDVQVKVYPNPTSHFINVSYPKKNDFAIDIRDINGKILYHNNITSDESVDVSQFQQGVYIIRVLNKESNKSNSYKFIKK
jgi:hypothetical protein